MTIHETVTERDSFVRRRKLRGRMRIGGASITEEAASVITSAPDIGAMACCNPKESQCKLQPTACVDNALHPSSVLCTGSCPADGMTLKCMAENMHCRQLQIATPIEYIPRSRQQGDRRIRRDDAGQPGTITINNVVRGWYCGMGDADAEIAHKSRSSGSQTTTSSDGFVTPSTETRSEETHSTESQPAETVSADALPSEAPATEEYSDQDLQPGSQSTTEPAAQLAEPAYQPVEPAPQPASDSVPVDVGQGQPLPVNNEECEWVDDFGNCCDPSEAAYLNPRRLHRVRRSSLGDNTPVADLTATSVSSDSLPSSHTQHRKTPRQLATSGPKEAANMPIVEAIFVVDYMYTHQQPARAPLIEDTTSWVVVPNTEPSKVSAAGPPQKTKNPRPHASSTTDKKASDPKAGLKAGIAVGVVVLLALVAFAVFRCRKRRGARRAGSERDSQAGPTRSRLS